MTTRVVAPARVLVPSLVALQEVGREGSECVVLWLAKRTADTINVEEVYKPAQVAAADVFRIPRESIAALFDVLRRGGLMVAAQVHTHPKDAFHSAADDRWAIVRHVGALSLVLPHFAQRTTPETFLEDAAVFRLSPDNEWRLIRAERSRGLRPRRTVSLSARDENAKTLASVFGLDEKDAGLLLDMHVVVRAASDSGAQVVRRHVVAMLRRAIATVEEERNDSAVGIEILIGAATITSLPPVRVGITTAEVVISAETAPTHDAAATVPEVVLLIAACYAAAMAIRVGIGPAFKIPHDNTIRLPVDILLAGRREAFEKPAEIGMAYLAGAGAVGNGFVWALATLDVLGELNVVDPKDVSPGNLSRCLWFEVEDVGQPKAERLVARARAFLPGLKLVSRVAMIQTLAERDGGPWLARLVVGVDSRRARRRLQEELPREVFDASTTGIEEVVLHFNSARETGACLSCIYHDDAAEAAHEQHVARMLGVEVADVQQHYVSENAARRIVARHPHLIYEGIVRLAYDTLFKTMCATGQLGADEARTVLAPLSFVSVLAGAYLALEVVCRTSAGKIAPPFNFWRASPWTSPVFDLRSLRSPRAGCETCGSEVIRATVRSLWGTNGKGPS